MEAMKKGEMMKKKRESRTEEKGKKENGEWMRGGKVGNKHDGNGGRKGSTKEVKRLKSETVHQRPTNNNKLIKL